ncbi:MAG: dTDP-4-dehydrorhamnose 3,5-epimerase [Cuniculiplasma sp.]
MNFTWERCELDGAFIVTRKKFQDDRGYFLEMFREDLFMKEMENVKFVQDNLSFSKKGVIRGLHFQKKPFQQGKLVSVVKGKILDVAINIEKNSGEFGKYIMVELSEENCRSLYIPDNCAHGFMALEDSYVLYRTTNYYNGDSESGIRYDDPTLNIPWDIGKPIVSEKDRKLPFLREMKEAGELL